MGQPVGLFYTEFSEFIPKVGLGEVGDDILSTHFLIISFQRSFSKDGELGHLDNSCPQFPVAIQTDFC